MDNQETNKNNAVPDIAESELKMPEEKLASVPQAAAPKGPISPLLVSLLIVSLLVLGVVIFWSDKLLDILMPPPPAPEFMMNEENPPTENQPATPEEEINALEEELEDESFADIENDLTAIEAEIEAGMATGTAN